MNHAELRAYVAGRIDILLSGGIRLPMQMRPYQYHTFELLRSWLLTTQERRTHIVYATGLGKTFVFSILIAACTGLRVIVVVPTNVLLEQTVCKIIEVTKGVVGILTTAPCVVDKNKRVIGIKTLTGVDVVVTTDESFVSKQRHIATTFIPDLIIYDECHWAYRHPALKVIDLFPDALVVAFTATPDYLTNVSIPSYSQVVMDDGSVLYGSPKRFASTHFGKKLDDVSISWGINEGYLAPLAWGELDLKETSLENVSLVEGEGGLDYRSQELNERLAGTWKETCQAVVRLYQSGKYELAKRHVFSVCSTVAAAEELAAALREAGYRAMSVSGKTPAHERRKILPAFNNGEIQLISSVIVLREGWDSPNADVCVMLRPTKSRLLYMQTIGRVLRITADDSYKIALILDAHYQGATFAPLSAPVVFGRPGQEVRKGGVLLGDENDAANHPEEEYMQVPVHLIEQEFQGNEDGTIFVQGERYELLEAYAARNGLKTDDLRLILGSKRVRKIRALVYGSCRRRTFYHSDDVEEIVFSSQRKGTPLIEEGLGIVVECGEQWWTLRSFMKEYRLTDEREVALRVTNENIKCIIRMSPRARTPRHFYRVAQLRAVFRDLIRGAL